MRHSLLRSHVESKEHEGKAVALPALEEVLGDFAAEKTFWTRRRQMRYQICPSFPAAGCGAPRPELNRDLPLRRR